MKKPFSGRLTAVAGTAMLLPLAGGHDAAVAFACERQGVQVECRYLLKGETWTGGYAVGVGGPSVNVVDFGRSPADVESTLRQAMSSWFDLYIPLWARGSGYVACGGSLQPFTGRVFSYGPSGSTNNGFLMGMRVDYKWGETVEWCRPGAPGVAARLPVANEQSGRAAASRFDSCHPTGLITSDWNYAVPRPGIEDTNYGLCFYPREPMCQTKAGNPITSSGIKQQTEVDWPSGIPLMELTRRYSSRSVREPSHVAASLVGRLADGWMFGFQRHLWIEGAVISAYRDDGNNIGFVGANASDGRRHAEGFALQRTARGWELRTPGNTVEGYDDAGRLVSVHDASGGSVAIAHDARGRIASVTSHTGRQLRFEYSTTPDTGSPGVLRAILLPDSQRVSYEIEEASGWLTGVTYPDGTSRTYRYTTQGNDPTPLLVAMTNEAGGVSRYGYAGGAAVSTSLPGGVGTWTLSQNRDTWGTGTSTMTGPNGAQHRVVYGYQGGRLVIVSNSQPAGSGCAAATLSRVHDSRGNVVQHDDLDAVRTCRAFEPVRTLETVRVEGLPSSASCSAALAANAPLAEGSRKLSTEWHPDWRLTRRVAEPRRMTLTVHHGQADPLDGNRIATCAPANAVLPDGSPTPLVCKEVQWATTDATGAAGFAATVAASVPPRTQSWTYDAHGRVLTWIDSNGQTTSYSYQPQFASGLWPGDLLTETNPLGHTVRYLTYSPNGQWLERIDANGVSTQRSYDRRQRLLEETHAGQTTTMAWTPTGQLASVTQPDGSWVAYEYDLAQRLTGINDSGGRRITYELDAAGNRIAETARDAAGNVRRTVQRRFDALNRVEQQTGREVQ